MTSEQIRALETTALRMVANGLLGASGQKWADDPIARHVAVGELRKRRAIEEKKVVRVLGGRA